MIKIYNLLLKKHKIKRITKKIVKHKEFMVEKKVNQKEDLIDIFQKHNRMLLKNVVKKEIRHNVTKQL